MSILKDTGIGFETVKKIPKDREIFFWPFATIFPSGGKTVYGKTSKKVVKFDMETLETEDIADVKPNVYLSVWYYPPHGYYVNEEDFSRGERTFYRIENNRLNPIRKFNLEKSKAQPSNATQKPRWQEEFWINENGVVRRKGKKVQVFVWPDLKELEFKGF